MTIYSDIADALNNTDIGSALLITKTLDGFTIEERTDYFFSDGMMHYLGDDGKWYRERDNEEHGNGYGAFDTVPYREMTYAIREWHPSHYLSDNVPEYELEDVLAELEIGQSVIYGTGTMDYSGDEDDSESTEITSGGWFTGWHVIETEG